MPTILPAAALPLARPEERAEALVVIYDGHCSFCRGSVEKLARWDTADRLAYLSLHDPACARLYPDLTHDDLMADMHAVTPAGLPYRGAEAWREIAGMCPPLFPAWLLLSLPFTLPLWQWLYQRIAQNRYWLFGKVEECEDGACGALWEEVRSIV